LYAVRAGIERSSFWASTDFSLFDKVSAPRTSLTGLNSDIEVLIIWAGRASL